MKYYTYISTRADYDPAKTILVFPPEKDARNIEAAARFAENSGWKLLAEYDGAVLAIPVVEDGWDNQPDTLPLEFWQEIRNKMDARNGHSLYARGGRLWCWETLIFWVGYQDGADFAGRAAVAIPNAFAAAALIGGASTDYACGEQQSNHWLVKTVSPDYAVKNKEIPVSLWLLGVGEPKAALAKQYYAQVNGFEESKGKKIMLGEIPAESYCTENYCTENNSAAQLLLSDMPKDCGLSLASTILNDYFNHVIRWKDGPDGTLAKIPGRMGFYDGARFETIALTVNYLDYPLAVHLPEGMAEEDVKGLPLVISVHGRGEPAWLFADKNGWDALADKTRGFVVACPDSPGNVWNIFRDGDAFPAMVELLCSRFGLDKSRVYLTGFSNGGAITREAGERYPQLFAAIAPFNGPVGGEGLIQEEYAAPGFLSSGFEMPYWVTVGDNDPAAPISSVDGQLKVLLQANGCRQEIGAVGCSSFVPDEVRNGQNWYTKEKGYCQGERFSTWIYNDRDGHGRVGFTVMKNMPHGAIAEESAAAWEFFRHYSRPDGSRQVVWQA